MELHPADNPRQARHTEAVDRLVAGHREFLRFLESRLRDRAAAEDILQAAFVRTLEKGGSIRESESAVAWFYRLLRNALVDHYRRSAAEGRARTARSPEAESAEDPGLRAAVCACMRTLLPTLKPEYEEIVREVDLEEKPVQEVAATLGITANNATVRLHRARKALKQQLQRSCGTCATHGCFDCRCQGGSGHAPGPPA